MKIQRVKSSQEQELDEQWAPVLQDSPSTQEFQRAYDSKHKLFIKEGRDKFTKSELRGLYKMIVERIGAGKSVLEVGPGGHGVMSFALARQGNLVVGLDISEIVLENLRSKLSQEANLSLSFEYGDARDLRFEYGSFDYVISTNLLEHLSADDGRRHLREVWRVLRNGGCYLFFVPSRILAGYRSAGFHLHMYSLREAVELASSLGFRARWIEPKFRRLGIRGDIPPAVTFLFIWYERGLERLRKACPKLTLRIKRYTITPTVMVAAYKDS
jgi:ubiquinone/menaquinone biosynthesis C-methylase UbiE